MGNWIGAEKLQINGLVRPRGPKDVTMSEYDRAVVRLLLLSNNDPSDSRYGFLTPEECGVLNRMMLRSSVNP